MNELISKNHPGPVDSQNAEFRAWLDQGMREATARAATAKNFFDYKRTLQLFANGFNDGHLEFRLTVDSVRQVWPGFLPTVSDREPSDHIVKVALSNNPAIPLGALISTCDGIPAWKLLEDRVLPFWWNRKIPNRLPVVASKLFLIDAGDQQSRLRSCTIEVKGAAKTVNLNWGPISNDDATALQRKALGWVKPTLGVRQIDGVWFVSMPSFFLQDDREVAAFRAMLAELAAKRDQIRLGPLVLDVRTNNGGADAWGKEALKVIWGDAFVDSVDASLGRVIDWRVSPENIERHEHVAQSQEHDGMKEGAVFYRDLAEKMRAALKEGRAFVRTETNKPADKAAPPSNPVTGHAYILTDGTCFSACLGFVDVARRLPGVQHVGLETSADTVYMENTNIDLPSGLALLSYSQKVYRGRVRNSNVWYEPERLWPGGEMTDAAVARWINQFEQKSGSKN